MRKPMDNLMGCYKQLFGDGLKFSYDLDELADTYKGYRKVMAHWHKMMPGKILDVHYEDLVNDQEQQSRVIFDYLNIAWDPACLDFHKNKRISLTVSANQIRQPMFNTAIDSWKKYESQLEPLTKKLDKFMN